MPPGRDRSMGEVARHPGRCGLLDIMPQCTEGTHKKLVPTWAMRQNFFWSRAAPEELRTLLLEENDWNTAMS